MLNWIAEFLCNRVMRVGVHGSSSEWVAVLEWRHSGFSVRTVNDLPDWVVNGIRMFADDTKVWKEITRADDQESLQGDLNNLVAWSDKWLLKSNPEKFKVMHIGHQIQTEYEMIADEKTYKLQCSQEGKPRSLHCSYNLKPGLQCAKAASKAMQVL